MRYVSARTHDKIREETYRFYITDTLKGLTGAEVRYADIVMEQNDTEEESGEEIIERMRRKLAEVE